jgi:hypothetical protein
LPDGWNIKLIRSGNKDKVLKAFEEMDWSRFPKNRVCFFVDRDLSEFLGGETHSGENLYVTDNYSIENEAVNFGTMECFLDEILCVTGLNRTEIDSIRNLFESNLKAFSEAMAPLMAQILLWRREGEKVNLNDIAPKELFIFEKGRIKLNQSFNLPNDLVQYASSRVGVPKASDYEITIAEAEFRGKKGLEKYIRGKYLLWFFVQCGKAIHQAIPSICIKYPVAPKVRIELGVGNAIVVVAQMVRCPASLKVFLKCNYEKYIKETESAA